MVKETFLYCMDIIMVKAENVSLLAKVPVRSAVAQW